MRRFGPFLILLLFATGALGQTFQTTPDLITALPWADSKEGVQVTRSFLLNANTIVPAGSMIRLFYVRPIINDGEEKPQILNEGQARINSYSGNGVQPGPSNGSEKGTLPKAWQKTLKIAHETVWPNIASFREALDGMRGSDLRFVYKTPGASGVSDDPFNLVEGLLLAEKEGTVVVQAVQEETDAARGGFVAGDTIEQFNGKPIPSLSIFTALYAASRAETTLKKQKPYLFRVRHTGSAAAVEISLESPISLGGSMLDQ